MDNFSHLSDMFTDILFLFMILIVILYKHKSISVITLLSSCEKIKFVEAVAKEIFT